MQRANLTGTFEQRRAESERDGETKARQLGLLSQSRVPIHFFFWLN